MSQPPNEHAFPLPPAYRIFIKRAVLSTTREPMSVLQLIAGPRCDLVIYCRNPGTRDQVMYGVVTLWNPALKHVNLSINIGPIEARNLLHALLAPLDFAAALAVQTARAA